MRYRVIYFLIALCCLAAVSRLVDIQLIHGEEYKRESQQRLVKTSAISAPRGEILDRNGKAMVKNKMGFSVEIHYIKGRSDSESNSLIIDLCSMAQEDEKKVIDSLPLSEDAAAFSGGEEEMVKWKRNNDIPAEASPGQVLEHFCELYGIDGGYTASQKRVIAGVRFEMERMGFSSNNPFTLVSDISETLVAKIKESNFKYPGVVIATTPMREYTGGTLAAHILGRTGKIYKDEYEQLEGKGYSLNDTIGKQGIEKYCEEYLKGTDGLSGIEQSIDGGQVKIVESIAPEMGDNVVLTIDSGLQAAAERALYDAINLVRQKSAGEPKGEGADADCGAIAAIDVNTGEILALASYPTYEPARFNEDFSLLNSDERAPMFNRAIGGLYESGSTFKMVTAIAALEENVITPSTVIVDEGKYKYFDDYQPACWIYRGHGLTHGRQNITQALENSCNYFFYDVGRRTTIEGINKYARAFGLGEKTGIELEDEENTGRLVSKELRESEGSVWNPGDVLQVAIGQSDNMFTPLQLANYLATIVNGGTRYKAHLIKTVRNSLTGAIVYDARPEALGNIEMKPENYKAVMEGMKNVIELGTASTVFEDFEIKVGGKTGTAEVSDGSDNAIFVGFAPYDNPEVAVCAVIEHGAHGSNAGTAVRAVLEEYFKTDENEENIKQNNTLTR